MTSQKPIVQYLLKRLQEKLSPVAVEAIIEELKHLGVIAKMVKGKAYKRDYQRNIVWHVTITGIQMITRSGRIWHVPGAGWYSDWGFYKKAVSFK